ncbi:hypothetical protein H6S28_06415 [Escherichia coli]|nr:hypothetical protein H6S28_06415 [Escherichia coli]
MFSAAKPDDKLKTNKEAAIKDGVSTANPQEFQIAVLFTEILMNWLE